MVSYKLTNTKNEGVFNGGLIYSNDAELRVPDANVDANVLCAAGINVGTLAWVLKNYSNGQRVKVIHHLAKDIACIPTATDGKYRLFRCRVGTQGENDAITERVVKLYESMRQKPDGAK